MISCELTLRNLQGETIKLEVVRETMGAVDSAGNDGVVTQPGKWLSRQHPEWWAWYSWPTWWHNWNSRGRVAWNVELPAGKQVVLPYQWHYMWRN